MQTERWLAIAMLQELINDRFPLLKDPTDRCFKCQNPNTDSSVPAGRKRPRADEEVVPAPSIRLAIPPSRVQASLSDVESSTAVPATQDAELDSEATRAQLQEYQAEMDSQLQEYHAKMQEYQAKMDSQLAKLQEYQAKMEAQDRQLQELQEFHAKMEAAMQAKDAEIDRFRRIALQTAAAGEF